MAKCQRLCPWSFLLLALIAVCLPAETSAWWSFNRRQTTQAAASSIPSYCYRPSGRDCTWYWECLEAKIPCQGTDSDYAIEYAERYCQRYEARSSSFSDQGRRWIDGVRRCLQVALAPELSRNPSCSALKTKAFQSHVPCYVNPQGAPSICDLPFGDWLEIVSIVGSAFLHEIIETAGASARVGVDCLRRVIG